jgi:epoxide hydrolase 4
MSSITPVETSTSPEAMTESWTHQQAIVNGVRLHYVEQGHGPLVVLLHGFPEFWYSWRQQIPVLAAAGFHVVAPDMRGYNESEKPSGVKSYRIELLTEDVVALIHHVGESRASVVGHDWGGGVAWDVPVRHPEAVEKLIVLNAPPAGALLREFRTLSQLRKSWYMFLFQLPWLPETFMRLRGYAAIERSFRHGANPATFSDDDILRYKRAIAQPGALTAGINYYRAALRRSPREMMRDMRETRPIDVPTLLIWGERDNYLGAKLTEGLERWAPNIRVERIPDATHWVQMDAPGIVNQLIVDFLREP